MNMNLRVFTLICVLFPFLAACGKCVASSDCSQYSKDSVEAMNAQSDSMMTGGTRKSYCLVFRRDATESIRSYGSGTSPYGKTCTISWEQ